MANRHHHKKLRAAIRRRMRETGETHQKALSALARERPAKDDVGKVDASLSIESRPPRASFVTTDYFGNPMTIAVLEEATHAIAIVVPSAKRADPARVPRSPLIGGWMLRDVARSSITKPH